MKCINFMLWDPTVKRIKKPITKGKYIPLYPVYKVTLKVNFGVNTWFWLWRCSECGNERIMSKECILYDECVCIDKIIAVHKYPKIVKTVCGRCNKIFTYEKLSTGHEVKYCSKECRHVVKSSIQREWSEQAKNRSSIDRFKRLEFCTRKEVTSNIEYTGAYELCDHYHKCADYRVLGEMGPYYVISGECYTYSGINRI